MSFSIHLGKENFKFSCSHFTIFSKSDAERLHGHNYQISIHLKVGEVDPQLGFAFDFNLVKPHIKEICDELDEYILVPTRSPFLKVTELGPQIEVKFHTKTYSFPKEDTRLLPITNISTEELAKYFGENLSARIAKLKGWTDMEINVEETRGQSVSFSMARP
jgi:6-pyruvoyltetrahydropterin/6-carboxytetrahydropterin synthase